MSVVLNEDGIRRLLESEGGPVGQDLRRRAEQVARIATENAAGPVIGVRSGDLHSGIRFELRLDERGLLATVGTDARHRGFPYPAFHDRRGRPWLSDALRDGFAL